MNLILIIFFKKMKTFFISMYEIVLTSYLFTNQNEHLFVLPPEQRKKQMNYN